MAQLASLATLIGAGASIYGNIRQGQAMRAQAAAARAAAEERNRQLAIQNEAEARARRETLARTIAATRARLAAGGVRADEGSGAALIAGLAADAAAAQNESDALFRSRLAAGRRSLLQPDLSFVPFVRAGQTFGAALRSLLD
ncbi:MAG: hypothetical protein N2Z67_08595 [Acetobacteraceae bacterium]|nr:hypothetical protein [Acetobacteraceae bacterium]